MNTPKKTNTQGKNHQQELWDMLWVDTKDRMRETKLVKEVLLNKHLKQFQEYTISAFVDYETGYKGVLEEGDGGLALGQALWT